jgi:hypothetical protein
MTLPDGAKRAEHVEAIARDAYDRCHPDDTFDDMKRRSRFSKEDRGLLRDWLAFAERRLDELRKGPGSRDPGKQG